MIDVQRVLENIRRLPTFTHVVAKALEIPDDPRAFVHAVEQYSHRIPALTQEKGYSFTEAEGEMLGIDHAECKSTNLDHVAVGFSRFHNRGHTVAPQGR